MDILGISAFYHDSAACLVRDGTILAAAQEERFTGKNMIPASPAMPYVTVSRGAVYGHRTSATLSFMTNPW